MKAIQFLKDIRYELGKVIWPTRRQTIKMTLYVIALSLFIAAVLGAADYGLTWVMEKYILGE